MYAVIKTGGKQHKVKPGDVLEVELNDEGKTHVGKDLVRASVKGRLVGEEKGEKVKIFKYKAKTGYSKRQGHRQRYTLVEIEDISLGAKRAAPAKKEAAADSEE